MIPKDPTAAKVLYQKVLPFLEREFGAWRIEDDGAFHFDNTPIKFDDSSIYVIDSGISVHFEETLYRVTISARIKDDAHYFVLWTTDITFYGHCQQHCRLLVQRAKDPHRQRVTYPYTVSGVWPIHVVAPQRRFF